MLAARQPLALRLALRVIRANRGPLDPRAAAAALGVSEAELVAAHIGIGAVPLVADAEMLLRALEPMPGLVTAVRNDSAELAVVGRPGRVTAFGDRVRVTSARWQLTIRTDQIALAFAVDRVDERGVTALELFDPFGRQALSVMPAGAGDPLRSIASGFAVRSWRPAPVLAAVPPVPRQRPDDAVDRPALRAAWSGLEDLSEIAVLERRYGLGRAQIYRLLGPEHAVALSPVDVQYALRAVAAREVPVVVGVDGPAANLSYRGPIAGVVASASALAVADPAVRARIEADDVGAAYAVRTPTRHGIRPTVELFGRGGAAIASIAGEPSDPLGFLRWRALHEELSDL